MYDYVQDASYPNPGHVLVFKPAVSTIYDHLPIHCHDLFGWIFVYSSLKPSGNYMYRQFNIHNSTFCPNSVFMCFVWISEQTAIITLYNINWLVFITETECVYCAVRTSLPVV